MIILDDCSTDNSLEVINKYKDNPHISQIVVNKVNSGSTFKQWDKGIHLAKGEIIWIAESDDFCEAELLEKLMECWKQYPSCSVIQVASNYVDESGILISNCYNCSGSIVFEKGHDAIKQHMVCSNHYIPNASAVIFRKNIALSIPSDYKEYKASGDRLFWSRFLASSISWRFSRGAVDIIAGHSGIELALMVLRETGSKIRACDTTISISSEEYWAGVTLARYQWDTGFSFKDLSSRGLGLTQTIAMFNPMHEADYSTFAQVADRIIRRGVRDNSWLKKARTANRLTQEQLSVKSGVPIRLIRAYEQEKIDISNAEYGTIIKLRSALNLMAAMINIDEPNAENGRDQSLPRSN